MSLVIALPIVLTSAVVLFLPGLVVAWAIGLRNLWLWALAPAISTTLLCATSIVLPALRLKWTPLNVLLLTALFGLVVVALFKWVLKARFTQCTPHQNWPTIMAWGFCTIVLSVVMVVGIGAISNISHTFDNIFHLNAIALISDLANASPFEVARLTSPDGGHEFYPNAWHALVELSLQISGATIPETINGFNLVVATTVWPLGMLLLTRQIAGSSRSVTLVSGVLIAAFPIFPLGMLHYGVLYPFFFGVALAPVTLAVLQNLLGASLEKRISTVPAVAILFAGILPAIAIAHPGAMMAVLAFSIPFVFVSCFTGWRTHNLRKKALRLTSLGIYLVAGFILLVKLRPGDMWSPRMSPLEAGWQTLSLALWGYGLPLLTALLLVVGLIITVLRRAPVNIATTGLWIIGASLYFVAAGISNTVVRLPSGVWYGDAPRLAAIFTIAAVPIAALGAGVLLDKLATRTNKPILTQVIAYVVLISVVLVSAGYPKLIKNLRESYSATEDSALLTPDEISLLERLPTNVAKGDMIAGNPWTGTSLAYAIAGRQVIFPHILMNDVSKEREVIMDRFKKADSDPLVCEAVDTLDVRWVLDFGGREVHGASHVYPGIDNLEMSDAFELVDSEGDARLYRLTACD